MFLNICKVKHISLVLQISEIKVRRWRVMSLPSKSNMSNIFNIISISRGYIDVIIKNRSLQIHRRLDNDHSFNAVSDIQKVPRQKPRLDLHLWTLSAWIAICQLIKWISNPMYIFYHFKFVTLLCGIGLMGLLIICFLLSQI